MNSRQNIIEKLICELCPKGVVYKTIGEIAEYRRGSFPQPYGETRWYGGEGAMPSRWLMLEKICVSLKTLNKKFQNLLNQKAYLFHREQLL